MKLYNGEIDAESPDKAPIAEETLINTLIKENKIKESDILQIKTIVMGSKIDPRAFKIAVRIYVKEYQVL